MSLDAFVVMPIAFICMPFCDMVNAGMPSSPRCRCSAAKKFPWFSSVDKVL
ncbi:hypothetical protein RchiOBHm_Chr2g0160911 [Rosa chinensis]|uniref:Uncharacterized protein n=1 Tax=Rosa chinensis TaxID=74649 RepID=A0A2P6S2Q1_ROSCH|nr:hypothetical protein RchiOBHm_Chr2g0160911 [Rosa chinensis]